MILEWFNRSLARENVEVQSARTGEEALRLTGECSPMAMFLDVILPDIDGWEVLRRLKSDPALAAIPVVLSTMIDERRKGQELGAVDYLLKPVERGHLKQLIQHFTPRGSDGGVLIVEGDAVNREMLARLLRRQGKQVYEAADAKSAMEQLHTALPELVILDLMLPGVNGLTLLKEIRQVKAFASVPIVVLTAKDLTEEDRRSLKGAVSKGIRKGEFNREDLLRQLTV